jgi:hypothetical protein
MAGVMSLMQPQGQQGPMPGQASQQPMPGMMPQQGAPTPAAMVGPLTQMHMQQLVQLMLNPRPDGPPLYAVLSALSEKQKAAKTAQAAQGQQAMAQNAQMQQQPPVAAQVMQAAEQMGEPVMAAYGGEMQSYAGGGAVAFQTAGVVPPGLMNPDVDEDGLPRGKDERERVIDYNNKIRAAYEQQMKSKAATAPRTAAPSMQDIAGAMSGRRQLEQFYKPRNPEAYTPEALAYRVSGMSPADAPGRGMAEERITPQSAPQTSPQPSATTFDITSPSSINALRMAAQDTSLPEAERADLRRRIAMMEGNRPAQSGLATLVKPQAMLTPEEEASYANRASTLRTRQGLPEDVLVGRQGITTLAAENLAAQRAEREQLAREAKEQRDAAMARSQRGIMNDPMSLLALAGSIDTRRGQGVGSLARGAAGLLGKREEQAEAARKEFALAQRDQRMLQANERQANMLEMQRQQAIRENDFTRVSQIEDQLSALEVQKSQLLRSRQEHAEKMTLDERKVDVMAADAAAKMGRPTEIDFFRQDPEGYRRFQEARRLPQTGVDRQDLAELKTLQANLQKQVENILLPAPQRAAAATQLNQVNARIAQMAGLDGAPAAGGQPIYARNPTTNERIMSTDGGKTWKPAQ